jgi:hypothetical protein
MLPEFRPSEKQEVSFVDPGMHPWDGKGAGVVCALGLPEYRGFNFRSDLFQRQAG